MVPIPNLQPLGTFVATRADTFTPIGYGPIAPNWPGRTQWLGRHAASFSSADWEKKPLPEGFDPRYFQSAPPDQQVQEIRPDERIVLEFLHVEYARLVPPLPGLRPRVMVDRATGEHESVPLVADTLWIDTDRGICTVVWRGRIGLRHPQEAGRITITLDDVKPAASAPELPKVNVEEDAAGQTCVLGIDASKAVVSVMPFSGGHSVPNIPAARQSQIPLSDGALPFGAGRSLAGQRPVEAPIFEVGASAFAAPMPSKTADASARPPSRMPRATSTDSVAPPPIITKPPVLEPIAPPVAHSPWVPTDNAAGPRAAPMSIGQLLAASSTDVPAGHNSDKPAQAGPNPSASVEGDKPHIAKDAALGGAAAASNAAADEAARAGRKLWSGHVAIDLIWINTNSMGRIRKHPAWKEILSNVKVRPDDEDVDDDLPPGRRIGVKDRRDILAVLSRGEPIDVLGIEQALMAALDDDDGFSPPLVLAAGELTMRYDELETLKATLAALAPHASGDKRVEEAMAKVQEMFKMPWAQGANGVLEETTTNLRKLFGEVRKGIAQDRFEAQIEQTLLDGRHYRKRAVFGQPRLVGALWSMDGKQSLPVYLPDHLAKELPTLRRMHVRVIGDVRPRAEEGERSAAGLRVVAVGRGMSS